MGKGNCFLLNLVEGKEIGFTQSGALTDMSYIDLASREAHREIIYILAQSLVGAHALGHIGARRIHRIAAYGEWGQSIDGGRGERSGTPAVCQICLFCICKRHTNLKI